jgi:hypothetical protein
MASGRIGALHVALGMDAAEFHTGVKGAISAVGRLDASLTSKIRNSLIQFELLKAGARAAFDATIGAISQAIRTADDMGKLSQSLGISTEQLSRLQHAAALSGVDVAEFRTGIVQLIKSMDESKDPMSEGGRVFAALGINVRDAAGRMRDADVVLSEVAAKFAGYTDGANKTAIAVALFGKAGDKLIPMLNAGAKGLRDIGAEADAFGITLNDRTAKAAEQFNDTLHRVNETKRGFVMQLTARLLPALNAYAEQMLAASMANNNMQSTTSALAGAAEFLARMLSGAVLAAQRMVAEVAALLNLFGSLGTIFSGTERIRQRFEEMRAESAKTVEAFAALKAGNDAIWSSWLTNMTIVAAEFPKKNAPIVASADSLKESMRSLKDEQRAAMDELLSDKTGAAADKLLALRAAVNSGIISWQQYGKAVRQVADDQAKNLNDMLSQASSTLGAMFEDSKAVAIAQALINTYQGVTKALATYPPPVAQVMAGLQLAAGLAQVASIRSTTKSGGGGGGGAAAPSGGAASAAASAGGTPEAGRDQHSLSIAGIDPSRFYSGEAVRHLVSGINEFVKDGGYLVSTAVR